MLLKASLSILLFSILRFTPVATETETTSSALPIEETLWQYVDDDITYQIRFSAEGKLVTSHPNDITPDNDFWKQMGEQVEFTYNNSFSKYSGKMVHEGLIEGSASNGSFEWQWKAYRIDAL